MAKYITASFAILAALPHTTASRLFDVPANTIPPDALAIDCEDEDLAVFGALLKRDLLSEVKAEADARKAKADRISADLAQTHKAQAAVGPLPAEDKAHQVAQAERQKELLKRLSLSIGDTVYVGLYIPVPKAPPAPPAPPAPDAKAKDKPVEPPPAPADPPVRWIQISIQG